MTQKSTIQVALVKEMKKGRGIYPVIDKFKTCMIEVSFDGRDTLELMSNNKDLLQIAAEMIERIYGDKAKSSGSDELQADLDESKVVWKFPKDASHVVNELYKKEMENVPKVETTMLHDSKQLIITCHRESVSEVRPKVIDLFELYKDSKWKDIDVRKKTKSAKTFCQVTNAEDCLCTYDESSRKINLVGKDKNSITSMEKEWETFYEKSSSKSKPRPATEGQVNKKDENTKLSVEDNMHKDKSKENEATGEVKSGEKSVRAVLNSPSSAPEVRGDRKAKDFMSEKRDHHQGRSNGPTHRIPGNFGASDIVGLPGQTENWKPPAHSESTVCHHQHDSESFIENSSDSIDETCTVGPGKYVFQVGCLKASVYKQSVVEMRKMDAIVNSVNDTMIHAGGVAGLISKAAGESMDEECRRYVRKHGRLRVADIYVSSPGKMACKGIFHAVGPCWDEYLGKEDIFAKDLHRTVYNCLSKMDEMRWKNIALCGISAGNSGAPKPLCAAMYLKAAESFAFDCPRSQMEVHFIDIDNEILDLLTEAHKKRLISGRSPDFSMALAFTRPGKGN